MAVELSYRLRSLQKRLEISKYRQNHQMTELDINQIIDAQMIHSLSASVEAYIGYINNMFMQKPQQNKQLPASPLAHLFGHVPNTLCFQCRKPSKQWTDISHGVFLCLTCAALFKELAFVTKVKSVGLDEWTSEEVERMERGGNDSFANFLVSYGLQNAQIRAKVTSKAAAYYRGVLDQKEMGVQPAYEVGREIYKEDIPLGQMSPQELFESAKEKAFYISSKTKSLGEKGIKKIQQKYESGQLKEGVKKVATTVSTGAKWLWGIVKEKVSDLAESNNR